MKNERENEREREIYISIHMKATNRTEENSIAQQHQRTRRRKHNLHESMYTIGANANWRHISVGLIS
jgi:hypothetical protein